jgi:hypothetical protein
MPRHASVSRIPSGARHSPRLIARADEVIE